MSTEGPPRRQGRRSGTVTLRDVATEAGVHPGTASRALDPSKQWLVQPATRARIQGVARALGYRPDAVARSLRSGQTRTVGVVVADIANPFIAVVIRAIANTLDGHGFLPFVVETQDDDERLGLVLDALAERRVDAIIMTAARDRQPRHDPSASAQRGVPVILAVRSIPGVAAAVGRHRRRAAARAWPPSTCSASATHACWSCAGRRTCSRSAERHAALRGHAARGRRRAPRARRHRDDADRRRGPTADGRRPGGRTAAADRDLRAQRRHGGRCARGPRVATATCARTTCR